VQRRVVIAKMRWRMVRKPPASQHDEERGEGDRNPEVVGACVPGEVNSSTTAVLSARVDVLRGGNDSRLYPGRKTGACCFMRILNILCSPATYSKWSERWRRLPEPRPRDVCGCSRRELETAVPRAVPYQEVCLRRHNMREDPARASIDKSHVPSLNAKTGSTSPIERPEVRHVTGRAPRTSPKPAWTILMHDALHGGSCITESTTPWHRQRRHSVDYDAARWYVRRFV